MTARTATRSRAAALPAAAALVSLVMLSACTDNAPAGTPTPGASAAAGSLTVKATDTACTLSATTAPAGKLHFSITNDGTKANEFYLLDADGVRVVGEMENIGPGVSRELSVVVSAGTYTTACKPGMTGDGIRAPFVVTPAGGSDEGAPSSGAAGFLVTRASATYASYVRKEVMQLLSSTQTFVRLYVAGSDKAARELYPQARRHWERVEPISATLKELGLKIDGREADAAADTRWTGWHRIEKDLWPERAVAYKKLSRSERQSYGDDLVANTRELVRRTRTLPFSADLVTDNARALLDETATSKVTGEEEYWSRTDLWDMQANINGAQAAVESVRPLVDRRMPALVSEITRRIGQLQKALDQYRDGNGFISYADLSTPQVKQLSNLVNAVSEPLSRVPSAVV